MVLGIPNSAIALALVKVAEEKNRIVIPTAAATSEVTNKGCGTHSLHPIYDTFGQTKTIITALTKQGIKDWYFITVDYVFGALSIVFNITLAWPWRRVFYPLFAWKGEADQSMKP